MHSAPPSLGHGLTPYPPDSADALGVQVTTLYVDCEGPLRHRKQLSTPGYTVLPPTSGSLLVDLIALAQRVSAGLEIRGLRFEARSGDQRRSLHVLVHDYSGAVPAVWTRADIAELERRKAVWRRVVYGERKA